MSDRSRATEPLFYRAPFAAGKDGKVPRDYQFAGAEFALARDHCLIGDEPGVGKTLQAILVGNALQAKRTLIVSPASLRLNWERECWRWAALPDAHKQTYLCTKNVSPNHAYNIISYDGLRNKHMLAAILATGWDHVVLDEAHAIKTRDTKRTKAVIEHLPGVTRRFTLLSGTILPNEPAECYNAVRLMNWDAIDRMSEDAFREYYYDLGGGMVRSPHWRDDLQANVNELHWSNKVRNVPRHMDELQDRLRTHVMIRRLKSQVLDQLPPKQYHLVPLAITPEMKAAMSHPGWGLAEKLHEINPDDFTGSLAVDGQVSTARRLLGEAKAPAVCDYIEDLLKGGTAKLVVAAWHTSVLTLLRERLEKYGLVCIDGSTTLRARQKAVDRFNGNPAIGLAPDPDVRIILGQTQVIGEGFTLTEAQDVVLAEPDWVPGKIAQVVDRCHRFGQRGTYVLAHLPVVPNTLDEKIVSTAIEKDQSIYLALDAVSS